LFLFSLFSLFSFFICFSFFLLFLFFICHLFMFFSCGLRASGITCIWFSIENMFLEDQNLLFLFVPFISMFSCFCFFFTKHVKIWKIVENVQFF
jgi:hypothetical protein